ncbi:MAG: Pr6Pr family membrane protein [Eubacteriales bacterium]
MKIKTGTAALIYRFALLLVSITGLILMTGYSSGKDGSELFCYYTVQSNLLVCLIYLFLCIKGGADLLRGRCVACYYPRMKGGVVLCIFATNLIFHFVLMPQMLYAGAAFEVFSMASMFVHYVVPLMTVADWLVFDKRLSLRVTDPLRWLCIPYVYFAGVLVRAAVGPVLSHGSRYPYFFIDVDKYGWLSASRYLAILTVLFLCLGYLIFLTDKIIGSIKIMLKRGPDKKDTQKQKEAVS